MSERIGLPQDEFEKETPVNKIEGRPHDIQQPEPLTEINVENIKSADAQRISELRSQLVEEPEPLPKEQPTIEKAPTIQVQETKPTILGKLKSLFESLATKKMETNILYRPDRLYRTIGRAGYIEFLTTGMVDSKNRRKYADVSFNIGEPAPSYLRKDPSYILEATPDAADFKPKINLYDPSHRELTEIPYRGCAPGEITNSSPVRIFELTNEPGIYRVVFDNIHDQGLEEPAE